MCHEEVRGQRWGQRAGCRLEGLGTVYWVPSSLNVFFAFSSCSLNQFLEGERENVCYTESKCACECVCVCVWCLPCVGYILAGSELFKGGRGLVSQGLEVLLHLSPKLSHPLLKGLILSLCRGTVRQSYKHGGEKNINLRRVFFFFFTYLCMRQKPASARQLQGTVSSWLRLSEREKGTEAGCSLFLARKRRFYAKEMQFWPLKIAHILQHHSDWTAPFTFLTF